MKIHPVETERCLANGQKNSQTWQS